MRGLAIALVVVFHAVPAVLGGGFIGVDVFFVISGFLITGILVRELRTAGRVDFAGFYVRRVRRLVPAAALALGVTLLLSALVVAPLDLSRVAGDGVAAALSVANIRFAQASGDYFGALSTPSPFLHYWSLSVEEQFYLVWPLFLLVALRIGRRPAALAIAVTAVALLSLALAVALTDSAAQWAFYSLPTRAWQLALGGLLAIAAMGATSMGRMGRSPAVSGLLAVLSWLGMAAIVAAGFAFDGTIAYPGIWALVPTLGAVVVIAAGDRRFGAGLLLRLAPVRFLGRISYALYLWHWPLLVLPVIAVGHGLPVAARLALAALAVLIATASTLLVEEPIRRRPMPASGGRRLVVVAGLGMVLLVLMTVGLGAITWVTQEAVAESRGLTASADDPGSTGEGRARSRPADADVEVGAALDRPARSRPTATPTPAPARRTPAPTATPRRSTQVGSTTIEESATPPPDPKPRRTPKPTPEPTPRPARKPKPTPEPTPVSRPDIRLPADVRPALFEAPKDEEILRDDYCLESEQATVPKRCVFGKKDGRFIVALLGDSHASHWFPALNRVAQKHGWQLRTFVKVSCPFTDIPVRNLQLKRVYRECARFNENTIAELRRIKPDLVVTAQFRYQYPIRSPDESVSAQAAGIARMLDRVPGKKVVIADVPFAGRDVPSCISKNLKDVRACAIESYRRTSGGSPARERLAAREAGGAMIDFGRTICGNARGSCPVVSDGLIKYRDEHHLTATYSRWLAPALDRALAKVLRS